MVDAQCISVTVRGCLGAEVSRASGFARRSSVIQFTMGEGRGLGLLQGQSEPAYGPAYDAGHVDHDRSRNTLADTPRSSQSFGAALVPVDVVTAHRRPDYYGSDTAGLSDRHASRGRPGDTTTA